jgi:predicted class III extradiol MEMO1 family dioxygenase
MRYPATEGTLKIDPAVKRKIRCDRPEAVILILVKSSDFCHFERGEKSRVAERGCLSRSG